MDARVKPAHDDGEARWRMSEKVNSRQQKSGESTYDSGKGFFGKPSVKKRDAKREMK
jgi:hypothetical protein